jgi:hypothetical protein
LCNEFIGFLPAIFSCGLLQKFDMSASPAAASAPATPLGKARQRLEEAETELTRIKKNEHEPAETYKERVAEAKVAVAEAKVAVAEAVYDAASFDQPEQRKELKEKWLHAKVEVAEANLKLVMAQGKTSGAEYDAANNALIFAQSQLSAHTGAAAGSFLAIFSLTSGFAKRPCASANSISPVKA